MFLQRLLAICDLLQTFIIQYGSRDIKPLPPHASRGYRERCSAALGLLSPSEAPERPLSWLVSRPERTTSVPGVGFAAAR